MDNKEFTMTVVSRDGWDPLNDNIDIEVKFGDGRRYTATVFTLENLKTLFAKNKTTGECGGGLYFWATEMIIVEILNVEVMNSMVRILIAENEFESTFTRVPDEGSIAHADNH
jgi:hypothetical protein